MTEHTKTHEVKTVVEHEWSVTFHPDGSMDFDPCPYCGEPDIFNARWEANGQMFRAPTAHNDDIIGAFDWDDWWAEKLIHVICNNCASVLYHHNDEYPDEQPVEKPMIEYDDDE